MFWLRNEKNIFLIHTFNLRPVRMFYKIVFQNVDNPNLQSSCDGVTGLDVEVFHVGHISIV